MDELAKAIGYIVLITAGGVLGAVALGAAIERLENMTPEEKVKFEAWLTKIGENWTSVMEKARQAEEARKGDA